MDESSEYTGLDDIAVIAMDGRFPEASGIEQFWKNLCQGRESVSFFSDQELLESGVDPEMINHPDYVKAGAVLDDIYDFDAPFFGISPRNAELMDPQQRLFLQCCWAVLEKAGYNGGDWGEGVGVFAGVGPDNYYRNNIMANREVFRSAGSLQPLLGNDRNFLSTMVSYRMDLRGPSLTLQTACSTSLVAVHLACQSLLNGECDLAMAGGVTINIPQKTGYLYREGGIPSRDGHCRTFDRDASGTVFGNGAAVVALKRLEDAVQDGDFIYTVIKGSAVNNDGSFKVGYTAPGVRGQSGAITEAISVSGVDPASISMVEAHGTGTVLGDPIEIEALTQAFSQFTGRKQYCAVGSVKTNVGHLDTAAGVTGLIKAALSLYHGKIPPSLNYSRPNPKIDFENSPFFVNTELMDWDGGGVPRRAGVSSFGLGGTNAHIVMEEPPRREESSSSERAYQLITLSAASDTALDSYAAGLLDYLHENEEVKAEDVAFTLQKGRRRMPHRLAVVSRSSGGAVEIMEGSSSAGVLKRVEDSSNREVVFMFPGQGAQYVNMGAGLYHSEPSFRRQVDHCAELLKGSLGFDIRSIIYPGNVEKDKASEKLTQTEITQPALFVVEYSLARLWMEWGIEPSAMTGHSIGEFVAACLAGVFSLEDCLKLVVERGRLMQQMPPGRMLAVFLPEQEVIPLLPDKVSLAAVNRPDVTVISGTVQDMNKMEEKLKAAGTGYRRLHTSHAFHSHMMDPILEPFTRAVSGANPSPPSIPYISNITGTWMEPERAEDPACWARQLRRTVRFSDGLRELFRRPERLLLEVGPGRTLTTLSGQHPDRDKQQEVLNCIRHPREEKPDHLFLMETLGKLWMRGVDINWSGIYQDEKRQIVPLPSYPFQGKTYRIEPDKPGKRTSALTRRREREDGSAGWIYREAWYPLPLRNSAGKDVGKNVKDPVMIFYYKNPMVERLVEEFSRRGYPVIRITGGSNFTREGKDGYVIDYHNPEDYLELIRELRSDEMIPGTVIFPVIDGSSGEADPAPGRVEHCLARGFFAPVFMARAWGEEGREGNIRMVFLSSDTHVTGGEKDSNPLGSVAMGPAMVIPLEYPNIKCRSVDVDIPPEGSWYQERLCRMVADDMISGDDEQVVAYRNNNRLAREFRIVPPSPADDSGPGLKDKGVYLITGGMGGMGMALASYLAGRFGAKLVLTGRSELLPRKKWDSWLNENNREDRVSVIIRGIREMEDKGGEVVVESVDAADLEGMKSLKKRVEQRWGRVDGVIHAAGVEGSGIIQTKTREMAEKVFSPKIVGTLVLHQVFPPGTLDFMAVCSSLNSVVPVVGQSDYCTASVFQDRFASCRSALSGDNTVAIGWDRWKETGMAVKAESPLWLRAAASGSADRVEGAPLVERSVSTGGEDRIYSTIMKVEDFWILDEHRIGGKSVVPGTAFLEMAVEAFTRGEESRMVEIEDASFMSPLVVGEDESREVLTVLTGEGDWTEFNISSREKRGRGERAEYIRHASGRIRFAGEGEEIEEPDLSAIMNRCSRRREKQKKREGSDEGIIAQYGPRWDVLEKIKLGEGEAIASLKLPENFRSDLDDYYLHPSLLDIATGFAAGYAKRGNYLPFWYRRLRVLKPLTAEIYSHARFREGGEESGETVSLDVAIMDKGGNLLAVIDEYTMKRVERFGLNQEGRSDEGEAITGKDARGKMGESDPAGKGGGGLSNREGIEIFRRVIQEGISPQALVSREKLNRRVEEAGQFTITRIEEEVEALHRREGGHSRPPNLGEYVEPNNPVEEKLAEIWQHLLGIDRVGIRDNFFDLGGDSVIGLRIVVKAKENSIILTPPQLFEHQTIEELAGVAGSRREDAVKPQEPEEEEAGEGEKKELSPENLPGAELNQEELKKLLNRIDREGKDQDQ